MVTTSSFHEPRPGNLWVSYAPRRGPDLRRKADGPNKGDLRYVTAPERRGLRTPAETHVFLVGLRSKTPLEGQPHAELQ